MEKNDNQTYLGSTEMIWSSLQFQDSAGLEPFCTTSYEESSFEQVKSIVSPYNDYWVAFSFVDDLPSDNLFDDSSFLPSQYSSMSSMLKNGVVSMDNVPTPRCPYCLIEIMFGSQLKPWFYDSGIPCRVILWTYYRRPP